MKKLFTLSLFLLATAWAMAQDSNTFQFVDKDGNGIEDGATLLCNKTETDAFGITQIMSGLYVKNTGAPDNYSLRIDAEITRIDNGNLQICFPVTCRTFSTIGSNQSDATQLSAGETKDVQTEWFPETFGECIVTYKAMALQPFGATFFEKGGPTVTIHYVYSDPSGIHQVITDEMTSARQYSLSGQQVTPHSSGLRIIRMNDGSVRKVIIR